MVGLWLINDTERKIGITSNTHEVVCPPGAFITIYMLAPRHEWILISIV